MSEALLSQIEFLYENRAEAIDRAALETVEAFLDALESGLVRAASRSEDGWRVDERVKKGILLAFYVGNKERRELGPLTFIDKANLWPRSFRLEDELRVVPGGTSVRRGAFLGRQVTVMPPAFINIGAYVDDGTMVDSHALVGSCAQVGKRVHISAAAQIGGVLEPVGALPIIIEDDVLVGGNCGIYEGVLLKSRAVLGAGVILTKSCKVFDLVNETIITADANDRLVIPENAVLVPGTRAVNSEFGRKHHLAIASPLIIKYRDDHTNSKTSMEALLRM